MFRIAAIFRRERPDYIVSTGAEIAVPAFLVGWVFGIRRLYIECGCQVTEPSLTGRMLLRISTRFFVQWRELVARYNGRAEYAGSLIDEVEL